MDDRRRPKSSVAASLEKLGKPSFLMKQEYIS
jgi:hypothetical protein